VTDPDYDAGTAAAHEAPLEASTDPGLAPDDALAQLGRLIDL
jgi:hypothetical protein